MSPDTKTTILKLHRWIGLAFGLLILVQGLTGMVVGFRDELNRLVHSDAMVVTPNSMHASLADIAVAARALRDGGRVTRIDYPAEADEAYLLRVEGPRKDDPMILASFDPGTGKMLRAGPLVDWPVEWAFFIHYTLLNGDAGERVVGFIGFSIIAMTVMGLLVWWPGLKTIKGGLKVKFAAGPIRALRDLHRAGGAITALLILAIALTGMLLAWKPFIEPIVYAVAPMRDVPVPAPLMKECTAPRTLDDSIAAAREARVGQSIKSVRFPGKSNGQIVAVYFNATSTTKPRATDYVWVDACTAQPLATKEAATALAGNLFFDWLLPIHAGEWLGLTGRIMAFLGAFALAGFGVTGYVLWFARKTKKIRSAS